MREIPIPMWLQLFLLCASIVGAILTTIKVVKWIQRGVRKLNAGLEAGIKLFGFLQHEYSRDRGDSHKDLLVINNEKLTESMGLQKQLIELIAKVYDKMAVSVPAPHVNITLGEKDHDVNINKE